MDIANLRMSVCTPLMRSIGARIRHCWVATRPFAKSRGHLFLITASSCKVKSTHTKMHGPISIKISNITSSLGYSFASCLLPRTEAESAIWRELIARITVAAVATRSVDTLSVEADVSVLRALIDVCNE